MKNTFGNSISVTLFGESHSSEIGAVLDGLAPGIKVSEELIAEKLSLRRPWGIISTGRVEADHFRIVSGVFNGYTTGTPVCILIPNENTQSRDYTQTRQLARQGVNHHREHHIFFFPDIHTFTQYAHVAVQHGWHPYIAVALNGQQVGNHLAVVIRHHHHVGLVAWRPQAQFHQLSTVEVAALRQLGQCGGVCMDGDFHTAKLYHFFRTTKYLGVGIWQLLIF